MYKYNEVVCCRVSQMVEGPSELLKFDIKSRCILWTIRSLPNGDESQARLRVRYLHYTSTVRLQKHTFYNLVSVAESGVCPTHPDEEIGFDYTYMYTDTLCLFDVVDICMFLDHLVT